MCAQITHPRTHPFDIGMQRPHLRCGRAAPDHGMTMGEGVTATHHTGQAVVRKIDCCQPIARIALAAPLDNLHEARVRRCQVIKIDAILDLQLPVAIEHIGRIAGHDLEALFALVDHHVKEHTGVTQVLIETRHSGVQAAEQEAAILAEPRNRLQAVIFTREIRRVAGMRLVFDIDDLAARVICPAMVMADMELLIALLGVADQRAAVATGIQPGAQLPAAIARHDDRRAPDGGGEKIVRVGHLTGKTEKHPGALENVSHFEFEYRGLAKNVAMNAESLARIKHQPRRIDRHGRSDANLEHTLDFNRHPEGQRPHADR